MYPDSLSAVKIFPVVIAVAIFLLFKAIDSDKTQLNDFQRFNLPDLACFFVDFAQSKRLYIILCFKDPNLIAESQGDIKFAVTVPDGIIIVVCPDVGNAWQPAGFCQMGEETAAQIFESVRDIL